MKKILKNKWLWLTIFTILLSIFFCYLYVHNEDNVYAYDYVGYQLRYNSLSELIKSNFVSAIKETIISIRQLDYNLFPILFICPFNILLGSSRMVYECAMVLIYIVPVIILLTYYTFNYIYKKSSNSKYNIMMIIFILILTITYTRWWSPTLRGLPDIIGIIPLAILLLILKDTSFLEKNKLRKLVLIGVLIYLPFLSRRWYAYGVVSFYLTVLILSLIKFFRSKEKNKSEIFKNAFTNFFVTGMTTVILAIICQFPLIKTIIGENYANSYSAFQVSLSSHFINFYNEFGLIVIIFAIFAILYSLIKKKNRTLMLYCLLNTIIFSVLFCRTQGMGVHHYLGISLYIYILYIMGILYLIKLVNHKTLKIVSILCITIITILNFYSTFVSNSLNVKYITQNNKYYKFKYENYDNLIKLKSDLSKLLVDNNAKFIVTGSSDNISDSLLDVIGDNNIKNNIIYNSTVDLRDGIRINALLAKYVVVTNPEQYSMNKAGQQVMLYTNDLILNNQGIGKAYKLISDEYLLSNGCKAYIYEKVRPFTEEEVTDYLNYFFKLYPQWEDDYDIVEKMLMLSSYELGDKLGDINFWDKNTIYLHPGLTSTKVLIPSLTNKILKLKLYVDGNFENSTDGAGIVNVTIKQDGETIYNEEINRQKIGKLEIDLDYSQDILIEVNSGEELNCDWLYIDYELN